MVQLGSINLRQQSSGNVQYGEYILTVKPGEVTIPLEPLNIIIPLQRGWNLISFPGELIDPSPEAVITGSLVTILDENSEVPAALKLGEGYWALAITPMDLEVELKFGGTKYTRAVKRGWNLIGAVIFDAQMPEGVIQLASWNAETEEYESPTTLVPPLGYWALALADGEITVSTSPPSPPAPSATPIDNLWTLPLTLTDAAGHHNTLEMGIASQATAGYDRNLDKFVPPPAPGQKSMTAGFLFEQDENLSLQRSVMSITEDGETFWSLRVSAPDSAATLRWDVTKIPQEWSLQLMDEKRQIDMSRASSHTIPQGLKDIQLVLSQRPQEIKPSQSMLMQNYPNPFNPETWIPYQMADATDVSLTIYDVQGRVVRQLNLGHKVAGIYTNKGEAAYWDGRNELGEKVSSGLYFYRLKASNFNAVRRMVIVK